MRMRKEELQLVDAALQNSLSQRAHAGTSVENEFIVTAAHMNAGGVAADIFVSLSRDG